MKRSIATVIGIPCSSILTVTGWILIIQNSAVVLVWRVLCSFFAIAIVVISERRRISGLSKMT